MSTGATNKKGDDKMTTETQRISVLEQQHAAVTTDIRGIYAGLDEIRDVLVRIQESAKPNLNALFLVVLATCTFMLTVGGLTLAPLYRDTNRIADQQTVDRQNDLAQTEVLGRLVAEGRYFENELQDSEDLSLERHANQTQRIDDLFMEIQRVQNEVHYNRDASTANRAEIARVNGQIGRNRVMKVQE